MDADPNDNCNTQGEEQQDSANHHKESLHRKRVLERPAPILSTIRKRRKGGSFLYLPR